MLSMRATGLRFGLVVGMLLSCSDSSDSASQEPLAPDGDSNASPAPTERLSSEAVIDLFVSDIFAGERIFEASQTAVPADPPAEEDPPVEDPDSQSEPEDEPFFEDDLIGPVGPPCDAVTKVFQVSCRDECHIGVGIGDFALGPEEARSYVGKPPTLNSPQCGLMIDPDNPFESLILTKVTGDAPYDSGDCRTLMPPPRGGITDEQIECLESWLWQFRTRQ